MKRVLPSDYADAFASSVVIPNSLASLPRGDKSIPFEEGVGLFKLQTAFPFRSNPICGSAQHREPISIRPTVMDTMQGDMILWSNTAYKKTSDRFEKPIGRNELYVSKPKLSPIIYRITLSHIWTRM